jgi:hypothetical protein
MPITPLKDPRPFEKPSISPEKLAKIRQIYKEEQTKPYPKAVKAEDIPLTFECITEEWLTATLGNDVPDAKVTSFSLGPPDVR